MIADMLRACMLDGFGWFQEQDYRRAWLLFDGVDYVFPENLTGPLLYPLNVYEQPEWRAVRLSTRADAEAIAGHVARDCTDTELRAAVAAMPIGDLRYARQVVASDGDLAWILERHDPLDPVPPISILASKLLRYAAHAGAVPIVGRDYAWSILARKLAAAGQVDASGALLGTPRQQLSYSALEAGLSLPFLSGDVLARVPFETLQRFKSDHHGLLQKHQAHLLKVVHEYRGQPEGADFAERVAQLRSDAQRERIELDDHMRDAWASAGLELAKKVVVAGAAAAVPALIVLRTSSLQQLLTSALPVAAAAAGVGVATAIDAASKARSAGNGHFAYLFQAEALLEAGDRRGA